MGDAEVFDQPSVQPPTREQIAEAIARAQNADYWIDEIREWNTREEWEREAHAEDEPFGAYEDRDHYLTLADAVLALFPQPTPSAEDRNAWDAAVQAKRAEQRAKGYTAEHDREHGVEHLLLWAQDYASRGRHLDAAALVEAAREVLFWQRNAKSDYDVIDEQYRGVVPPAEPPSIADMAPGTVFVGDAPSGPRPFRVPTRAFVEDLHTGKWWAVRQIDPSTVRDVTPPAVTPEEGDRG